MPILRALRIVIRSLILYRSSLVAENLALRHQLVVLQRSSKSKAESLPRRSSAYSTTDTGAPLEQKDLPRLAPIWTQSLFCSQRLPPAYSCGNLTLIWPRTAFKTQVAYARVGIASQDDVFARDRRLRPCSGARDAESSPR